MQVKDVGWLVANDGRTTILPARVSQLCRNIRMTKITISVLTLAATIVGVAASTAPGATNLWELANGSATTHRFSTLFTAHDVRNHLSVDQGIGAAIDWCKSTAVTKVYLESFR